MQYCYYCHNRLSVNTKTKDHKIPRSLGGSKYRNNIVYACSTCNNKKSKWEGQLNEFFLALKTRKTKKGEQYKGLLDKRGIMIYAQVWVRLYQQFKVYIPFDRYIPYLTAVEKYDFLQHLKKYNILTHEEWDYNQYQRELHEDDK